MTNTPDYDLALHNALIYDVNGVPVLRNGAHTNARPGRVVLGPGAADPA